MTLKVNERSAEAEALCQEHAMLEALMGGTRKMRLMGETLLPKFPQEDPDGYKARLNLATLFPAYKRTISVMVGKPFSKALTFSESTPREIAGVTDKDGKTIEPGWADDIDNEGVSLHVFAAEMFRESFYGLAGILVEAPKPIATAGPVATVHEQKKAGIRPYFVRVMHQQILGWKSEKAANGGRKLTQLRIKECVTRDDGAFGTVEVDRVRVLEPGMWFVYEEDKKKGEWNVVEEGFSGLPDIPFVPLYGARKAFMNGECPLIDLAYMNVEHWQSKSDQQTILHVARVPVLFAKGFQSTDKIVIGASVAVQTESGTAELKYVEHTGACITAGERALTKLEEQMIQAGAELTVAKASGGAQTATEDQNDAEGNKSDLQRQVENFEDSLNMALDFMCQYASLNRTAAVTLYKAFGEASLGTASATLIKDLMIAGKLSDETGISELQRRGELAPEINALDEAEKIAAQGPSLADMTKDVVGLGKRVPAKQPEPA